MPFDLDFQHHLHELMVEVSERVAEPEAQYKRQLIWKAQQTRNSAAMPIAYKDAALHALRTRFEQTVDKYLEALSAWSIQIDARVEREMLKQINLLTSAPNSLTFPPGLRSMNVDAVQSSYSRERQRLSHQLQREAANRLRELKMRSRNMPKPLTTTITNNFNAPVSGVYNNSIHVSGSNFFITPSTLEEIDRVSSGHKDLEDAAREIRNASSASMLDKAKKWIGLLALVEGLTEKAIQHYPEVAALVRHLSHS